MSKISSRIVLVIGSLMLFSCVTARESKKSVVVEGTNLLLRKPAGLSYPTNYLDSSQEANLTCAEFDEILDRSKPTTILAALNQIDAAKPKYFSYYSLMHRTLSVHGSSVRSPRVIAFGGNAETVLTFNGDPAQAAYGDLEVMCFHREDSTFEFREITFPSESNADLDKLTNQEKKQPFVRLPSDRLFGTAHDCRSCHLSPLRPNWETYPTWPGAYGAVDDDLFYLPENSGDTAPNFQSAYLRFEQAAWKKFARVGRYAILKDLTGRKEPNLVFGLALGRLNGLRIVAELKRLGFRFRAVKNLFAKALYCPLTELQIREFENSSWRRCGQATSSILVPGTPVKKELLQLIRDSISHFYGKDSSLKVDFDQSGFDDLCDNKALEDFYIGLGISENIARSATKIDLITLGRLAKVRKIVAPMGIDIRNWSLVLLGGYEFENGSARPQRSSFVKSIQEPFLSEFFPDAAELRNLIGALEEVEGANTAESLAQIQSKEADICNYLDRL